MEIKRMVINGLLSQKLYSGLQSLNSSLMRSMKKLCLLGTLR
nr:unnamed protein product [Callosobruchus chinensis]